MTDREPDLFTAHLCAVVVAGHLLQAHALQRYSGKAALERRKMAVEELDKLAAMFDLELVAKADAPADVKMGR